jgi:hypothetical protein
MDLVYHAINILFDGRLFFAPVTGPQRIVDMGTGTGKYWCMYDLAYPNKMATGIWALDVGDQYPEMQGMRSFML